MGLLGDFTAYIDNLKRRGMNTAKDLVSDPIGLLGRNISALSESLPAAPGEPPNEMLARPGMQDWAMGVALNAPTMGLLGHTVYHGSPHKFDKFDASKIGTGEGAQAYGHGVYLAESPGVANSYRENLSDRVFNIGGKELRGPVTKYGVADPNAARAYMSVPEKMATYALDAAARAKSADPAKDAIAHLTKYGKKNKDAPAAINLIRQWSDEGARVQQGNLYKVDLPDEWLPKMLDWDKPISEQSPNVKNALKKAGLLDDAIKPYPGASLGGELRTGRDVLESLRRQWNNEYGPDDLLNIDAPSDADAVSQFLNSLGIPGIRYLDGNSRSAGSGSSNYVVFPGNEGLLKILNIE